MTNIIIPATDIDPTGFTRHRTGKTWNSRNVSEADRLLKVKKHAHEKVSTRTGDSPVWDVLEEVYKGWKKLRPHEYKSSIIEIQEERDLLKDKKYGQTKTKSMRRILDIPVYIELVMRQLYTIEELPFDKEWYRALHRKIPIFRVAEKL